MNERITTLMQELKNELESMPLEDKVSALNNIKHQLKEWSPFEEPVDCVHWVPADQVHGNDYNPNKVANPEMKLLHQSIKLDGYTQPIVCYKKREEYYEVVDGFHRNRIGKEYADIHKRIHGYLPVVVIDKPMDERMGSTIRHNRARGTHQIRSMSDIVIELSRDGWEEEQICAKLGMELDEVIRLKQISGLKEAFQNHDFSKSWDEFESRYYSEG